MLRKETTKHWNGFEGVYGVSDEFHDLAATACDFIHWVVHYELSSVTAPRKGLDALVAAAGAVDELDIFTLNHDTILEAEFEEAGIPLNDGFSDVRGDLRAFSGWSNKRHSKIHLLKLHGSIDWFLQEFEGWTRQYAISRSDWQHSKDECGRLVTPVEWKAAFLSGTSVKEIRYGHAFWTDIFESFRRHLNSHRTVVCCGYGFTDTGINNRINQWALSGDAERKSLIILTPQKDTEYFADKPAWMLRLREEGTLKLHPNYLQDCNWADLEPYFETS